MAFHRLVRIAHHLALGSLVACGSSPKAPPPSPPVHEAHQGHGPGHDHAHAPLVHRFEDADRWSKEFDDPARDAWQKPREVVDAMAIQPGMVVADLGAGTGYFEPWLSRATGVTGTVLALDVEPDMVRFLDARVIREKLPNVKPALVALDDPKLPEASVDRILVVDVWHHIQEREAYAAKLRSGLRRGGKVFVVDFKLDAPHGPPARHRLPPEQLVRELGAAGLTARVLAVALQDQYIVEGTRP